MTRLSNTKAGAAFEGRIAQALYDKGYWVHLLQANKRGQPMDLVAVGKDQILFADCKLCQSDKFQLRRVEDNQWQAMDILNQRTRPEQIQIGFIIGYESGDVYVPYRLMKYLHDKGQALLTYEDAISKAFPFEGSF